MKPRSDGPEFSTRSVRFEISDRTRAINAGGLGAILPMVADLGLAPCYSVLTMRARSWCTMIGLGLAGMLVGGIIARLLIGTAGGFLFAFIGALLLLALYRKYVQKRPVFRG